MNPVSGTMFAADVRAIFGSMGCDLRAVESIFTAGGGPGMALEALEATVVALEEIEGDYEMLERLLPDPDSYCPLSRWETENMLMDMGVTPPTARTPTGFFNKLRCMCMISREIGWRLEILRVDDPEVRLAFAVA